MGAGPMESDRAAARGVPPSDGGPVRRVITVLLIYVVAAYAVLVLGEWMRRLLALPLIFETLLRGGVALGAGVAAALAWHYPKLATGSDPGGASRLAAPDRPGVDGPADPDVRRGR